MGGESLLCICGYELAPDDLVVKANTDSVGLYCPNPNCRLGLVAIFQKVRNGKKLRLVKIIEEFNMLFIGTEELQIRMKRLETMIEHKLSSENIPSQVSGSLEIK